MTDAEFIALTTEAGFEEGWVLVCNVRAELTRLIELAAAKEREACKAACDTTYYQFIGPEFGEVRYGISACKAAIDAIPK